MTHEPLSALLRAALDAAERGWHVFPLRPGGKRPALHGESACAGTGNCATGHRKWEQRATTDPDRIRAAWATGPFNVGIATGPSGLVVVDLDVPKSGATTVVDLHGRRGDAAFLADVVYVGRPLNKGGWNLPGHPLANPFPVGRGATRAEVVEQYRAWLADQSELVARELPSLRGKRLGCWCPPGMPCHARVLAELLNTGTPDGVTTFTALCERAGQAVPTTYRTRTPSGGQHLYFTAPTGVRLTNTAGTLAPLVDTRASGGYVVAAGSTTPTGPYEALCGPETAALPGWLLSILKPAPKPVQAPPRVVTGQSRRYADVALDNEVCNVATAGDGTRNATLLRAARALGRFIASGDLTRTRVEDALRGAAGGNATEPQRYYDDVIRRALDWSITHNSPRGRAA